MARSTLDPDNVPRKRRKTLKGHDTVVGTVGEAPAEEGNLQDEIAKEAYYRAEKRGFAPGYEEQDWKEAEAEVRSRRSKRR